jgi:pyrroline-5-carboxylate reductase
VQVLQQGGLQELFDRALQAAQQRAVNMAEELGNK